MLEFPGVPTNKERALPGAVGHVREWLWSRPKNTLVTSSGWGGMRGEGVKDIQAFKLKKVSIDPLKEWKAF